MLIMTQEKEVKIQYKTRWKKKVFDRVILSKKENGGVF
jgi:hypothetical protein